MNELWTQTTIDRLQRLLDPHGATRSPSEYDNVHYAGLEWIVGADTFNTLEPSARLHQVGQSSSFVNETTSTQEVEVALCQSQRILIHHEATEGDHMGRIHHIDVSCIHYYRLRPTTRTDHERKQVRTFFMKTIEWIPSKDNTVEYYKRKSQQHIDEIQDFSALNSAIAAGFLILLVVLMQRKWNKARVKALRGSDGGDGSIGLMMDVAQEPLLPPAVQTDPESNIIQVMTLGSHLSAATSLDPRPAYPVLLASIVGIGWHLTSWIYSLMMCTFFMSMDTILWMEDVAILCFLATCWIGPWVGKRTLAEICPDMDQSGFNAVLLLTWGAYPFMMLSGIWLLSTTSSSYGYVVPRLGTTDALMKLHVLLVFVALPMALFGWYLASRSSSALPLAFCEGGTKGIAPPAGTTTTMTTRVTQAAVARLYKAFIVLDATTRKNKPLSPSRLKFSKLFVTWTAAPTVGFLSFGAIFIPYYFYVSYILYGNSSPWDVRWSPWRWTGMLTLMFLQAGAGSFLMTFFKFGSNAIISKENQGASGTSSSSSNDHKISVQPSHPPIRWRWASVWCGLVTGVYMLVYNNLVYFRSKTNMSGLHQTVIFIGYTSAIAITIALSCASVCYSSSRFLVLLLLEKVRKDN